MDMNKLMQGQQMQSNAAGAGGGRQRDRRGLRRRRHGDREATGGGEIVGITIDPRAIDPDDPEMLADLVLAAVNEALRSASADGIDANASRRTWQTRLAGL
jgi:hypothetical protein